MATRISALPVENNPVASEVLALDGSTTRSVTIQKVVDAGAPVASQAEAEAGVNNVKRMTPLTTAQALEAQIGVTIASAAAGDLAQSALQPDAVGTTLQPFSDRLQEITIASGTTGQVLALQPDDTLAFTNAGAGDMITAQYDPDAIGANAFDAANQVDFALASASGKTIPAPVMATRTSGYFAAGDGGGGLYRRVGSEPSHAGKFQSLDGAWWELADTAASVRTFGAKDDGDGAGAGTDNASALQNALTWSAALGTLVELPNGKIFRCDTPLTFSGEGSFGFYGGGTLDFTNYAGTDHAISITGPAWSNSQVLTANSIHPSRACEVADATLYPAGRIVRMSSSKVWAFGGSTHSEFLIVASSAGTTVTFTESVRGHYTTADGAKLELVDTSCRPVLDVTIIGAGSVSRGIQCQRVAYAQFAVRSHNMNDRALQVLDSVWCSADGLHFFGSDREGLGYGLSDLGNQWCNWGDIVAHSCRHPYTGGSAPSGSILREITIGDVIAIGCRDAVVDTHDGASDITFGNIIGSMKAGNGSDDAVTLQGCRIRTGMIFINGDERHGLMIQFSGGDPDRSKFFNIEGFTTDDGPTVITNDYSVTISNSSDTLAQVLDEVVVGYLNTKDNNGVLVNPVSADISRVVISGGSVVATSGYALFVQASALGKAKVVASATKFETQSSTAAIIAVYAAGSSYTTAHAGVYGAEVDLLGCETVGGVQNHLRAADGRISFEGGSRSFSGTGAAFVTSGIGEISGIGKVAVTPMTANKSLSVSDMGKMWANNGTTVRVDYTLPEAEAGLEVEFLCLDADGLRVVAKAGDTIILAASSSTSGGYVQTTTVRGILRLRAVDTSSWVAMFERGTWTVA